MHMYSSATCRTRTPSSIPLGICKAVAGGLSGFGCLLVRKMHTSWRESKGEVTRRLRGLGNLTFVRRLGELSLFSLGQKKKNEVRHSSRPQICESLLKSGSQ